MSYERSRGSVFLEDARILAQRAWPGEQFVLRVQAPRAARKARPGTFAHIACDPSVPMRRPLSIMRAAPEEGWLEFLYKPKGHGLETLGQRGRPFGLFVPLPLELGDLRAEAQAAQQPSRNDAQGGGEEK